MPDKERAVLALDDDLDEVDELGLGDFATQAPPRPKPTVNPKVIRDVAEQSGFVSRQPQKMKRSRRRSPYTIQTNFKTRPGMKDLIQQISERLDTYDQETLELAIGCLLEKNDMQDLLQQYRSIIS